MIFKKIKTNPRRIPGKAARVSRLVDYIDAPENRPQQHYRERNRFLLFRGRVAARWSADDVTVTVADDGPGFPPELMDSIGEPYVSTRRLNDKREKEHSGLGLGFFIARTLLERSGASVNFSNRPAPQHGAVIRVTWPRKAFERRNIFLRTMQ